jgi:hypothetical protein
VPVVSTAFRPLDRAELAANPFRVFTSVLVPEDQRFFGPDLECRLRSFLAARELFPPNCSPWPTSPPSMESSPWRLPDPGATSAMCTSSRAIE